MGWPTLWVLSAILCLGPSQALGQEGGACPGERGLLRNVGTCIPVYACRCGIRKWDITRAGCHSACLGYEWMQCHSKATPFFYLFLFCADVKIVGLGAQDKVAVIQSCPAFPGPPGPKGDRGSPAQKGRDLDRGDCPVTSPLVSPPPVPPRGWGPV